jgi:hypothetical protein
MEKPYIFISHSSKDNNAVAELVDDLQANHLHVWVDFDKIENGEQWLEEIQSAMDDCAAVVVVLSRVSRKAEWVMREILYAMQLRKPLLIARMDDVLLPLILVDRQYTDFSVDYESALAILLTALKAPLANPTESSELQPLPEGVSQYPNEDNFFSYLEQLEQGEARAIVARDLYWWLKKEADTVEFSGQFRPAFHAKLRLGDKDLTVFSLSSYLRNPAVQIAFDHLRKYPPYSDDTERLSLLHRLENILPQEDTFEESRADRRPTIPLDYLLGEAERLENLKEIVAEIIQRLRET